MHSIGGFVGVLNFVVFQDTHAFEGGSMGVFDYVPPGKVQDTHAIGENKWLSRMDSGSTFSKIEIAPCGKRGI